jgi:Glycosyl hydrolase family 63 C-terminal domain
MGDMTIHDTGIPSAPSGSSLGHAERERLATGSRRNSGPWKEWGPYVSEREWGTVREDYSEHGNAWEYFPHDHARSRAYRWSEDGLAGICDITQRLCFGLALWNHRDPILKERLFGLTGNEGNHGEDVKEYYWYLDSTPTHSFMRWKYLYPQGEFPYEHLVAENRRRGKDDPEFELVDSGALDGGRFWEVSVVYAKAGPEDVCITIDVRNCGDEAAHVDVLPSLWFRNTWSWGLDDRIPSLALEPSGVAIEASHWKLGTYRLEVDPNSAVIPDFLFCDNETNTDRLFGTASSTPFPKDGINDHVVHTTPTVNPAQTGTKASVRYQLHIDAGASAQLRLRLRTTSGMSTSLPAAFGQSFNTTMDTRRQEADDFYRSVIGDHVDPAHAEIARQALASMLWSKQFFHIDIDRWLDGDPSGPPPPASRATSRNARWRHLNNLDVISMPDKWEYPWYAAWDLAFHCVTLSRVDPDFAKHQLTLLCREWYMHPNGQLPAYEWAFDDANPPVHGWAVLRVFEVDGSKDYEFLEGAFHKLLLNFTWWVNRKDANGNNVFEGGFLGLDNIGPFDRSNGLPAGGHLDQSDGTAWMAMYCLNMLEIALVLADHDTVYEDMATKFFEHFAYIATAMNQQGLWDEQLGFYRDLFRRDGGDTVPIPAISMVGLVPLFAVATLDADLLDQHHDFASRVKWFIGNKSEFASVVDVVNPESVVSPDGSQLLSIVDPDRLRAILHIALDEQHLLSPYGLRSVSAWHRDHPVVVTLGDMEHRLDYEPAESRTGAFGGNSNWRGPIWFPMNYLVIESLRRFHLHAGDGFLVEYPTGSGSQRTLADIADDLASRLISLLLPAANGSRPAMPRPEVLCHYDGWNRQLFFHEYFHGDNGRGLGASHQTGWTGLITDLILGMPAAAGHHGRINNQR